jgi:hypothetical protein
VRSTQAPACPNLQQDVHHGMKAGLQDFPSGARRDVEGRHVVRFHGVVVAAARWGAAGQDTRDHSKLDEAEPRLGGRSSRAQGSARRLLAARRRVEGFPLGPAQWGAA